MQFIFGVEETQIVQHRNKSTSSAAISSDVSINIEELQISSPIERNKQLEKSDQEHEKTNGEGLQNVNINVNISNSSHDY